MYDMYNPGILADDVILLDRVRQEDIKSRMPEFEQLRAEHLGEAVESTVPKLMDYLLFAVGIPTERMLNHLAASRVLEERAEKGDATAAFYSQ